MIVLWIASTALGLLTVALALAEACCLVARVIKRAPLPHLPGHDARRRRNR